MKGAQALAAQNVFGQIGFAFFQDFADTDDGHESRFQRGFQLEIDGVVGFAEVLAAFGMADDDMSSADIQQHAGANFAGESAFFFPVHVLPADCDIRSLGGFDSGSKDR